MTGIRIELKRVEEINIRPRSGNKVVVSMEAYLPPGEIGRLYNMAMLGVPVQAIIESPQAELDLIFQEVNTFTGEVVDKRAPVAVGEEND